MKVQFIGENGDSASAFYRCYQPAAGLQKLGVEAEFYHSVMQADDGRLVGMTVNSKGQIFRAKTVPDVVVCRRMANLEGVPFAMAEMFIDARQAGQLVFVDLDDNIWHIPADNPAYRDDPIWRKCLDDEIQTATAVITSSEPLMQDVMHRTKRPVWLCRSGVNHNLYPFREHREHFPLRIGWMGLTSFRGRDLAMIAEPLREALLKHKAEFWHLGHRGDQPPLDDYMNLDGIVPAKVPWTPIQNLGESLAYIDVLVIPQIMDMFGNCRSATTGLAAMAATVSYLASRTYEYDHLWLQGGGYVTDNNVDDWATALDVMCSPAYWEARSEMTSHGKALATLRYSLPETARQWLQVFECYA